MKRMSVHSAKGRLMSCVSVNGRLVGHVARRFLSQGISSMLLFGEARNPSNGFYEALGAERLFSTAGEFHGGYGWRDLRPLASYRIGVNRA